MKGISLLTALLFFSSLYGGDLDEALGGFEEERLSTAPSAAASVEAASKQSWIELSGAYTLSTAYNYQPGAMIEGVSRLRNKLELTIDMSLSQNWRSKIELKSQYDPIYALSGTAHYTNSLEYLSEVKEAYVLGTLGRFDLKVGRQIVVWGKSDSIRITDLINPLDNREPGIVDIEDLRLAVAMSKLSFYAGDWSVNLMAIHEARVQYEAGIDSEFFPTSIFNAPFAIPESSAPASTLENTQFAASADGRFSGWDLSFYAANVFDQRWHLVGKPMPTSREYGKIRMGGIAANVALGSWLLKMEAAYLDGLIYNTTANEKHRLDALVGVEYTGLSDWLLSLEYADRHLYEYESKMADAADFVREDEVTTAFRGSYTFDHDNGTVTYLLTLFGLQWQDGGFQRLWMSYKLNDQVTVSAGLIDYRASTGQKPFFDAIADNDRIFLDAKYSF